MVRELSWWDCSEVETIRPGRRQLVGNPSALPNNFLMGFTHGSTHPRIADLERPSAPRTHFLEVEHRLAKNKI